MGLLKGHLHWSQTGVGTNAGVTVTQAAASDATKAQFVTGIQVSGDAAALITIESPAATVLWKMRMTGAFDRAYSFPPRLMHGAVGQAVLVKISASTSNCEANIQGLTTD